MSAPFIVRPIATILLIVAIVALGLLGYRVLPVAALPNVDFPTIEVVTSYPGASPDVVETSITAPLEHYFGQISGLAVMNSVSAAGTSQITLQFDLARNIDAAAQDVQSAINAATYGEAAIGYRNGAPLLLRDIGRAVDAIENTELAAWYDNRPAVILDVQRQPGANTIEVVDAVRALLPKLRAALPPGLKAS